MKAIDSLNREIKENRTLYGSRVAIKNASKGVLEKIYLANDAPKEIEDKLKMLKENNSNNSFEIIKLDLTKEALKDLCKKQFNISVVSVVKIEKEAKEKKREREVKVRGKKEKSENEEK